MKWRPLASCISIITGVAVASYPMGSAAATMRQVDVAAPEQPSAPTPAEDDPTAQPPAPQAADDESLVGGATGGSGVVVHVINERPDEDRGLIKLARYRGTTTQAGGNVIVFTTSYDEICTEPCGVPVDVSERPIFFFVRDQTAVSHGFRIKDDASEVTLSLRPERRGMRLTGLYLSCLLLLPISIPLMILGRSKVSLAPGAPSAGQAFRTLKKAKA